MEHHHFGGAGNQKDEALRWLSIATKLLTARDLMGSKSFATRAREADPHLIAAYQILAIADTLMASEKRIKTQLDWYAILQIQPTFDSEAIATQYRRLALLLNPQKNQLPFADQAFRLVVEAWAVLSNVSRKRAFDSELQINNANNNASGSTVMSGFMGGGSGQMENVGNVGGQNVSGLREEDGMGNGGNNVWVSRDDGRGGSGGVGGDINDNVDVDGSGNVPIDEVGVEDVGEDDSGEEGVLGEDDGLGGNETSSEVEGTFWTACPYCYHLFEYPKVYIGCTFRCQKCTKAIHGVEIASPPPIVEGEEAYFCCWGYMPLAVSVNDQGSGGGGASNWAPFSPMFTCPQKPGNMGGRKTYDEPRFYHDDDDVYVEVPDSSGGSDDDWQTSEKKKKTKSKNRRSAPATPLGRTTKKQQIERAKNVNGGSAETMQHGSVFQGSRSGAANVMVSESSSKGPASNTRRQSGRVANGKLDLNVEFSNETEEQVPRRSLANGAGHGNEDTFEGTGFFEGLDEFLSSLPILTGVPDDRVKAA